MLAEGGSYAERSERVAGPGVISARKQRVARRSSPFRHSCGRSISAILAVDTRHGGEKGSNCLESHGGGRN